jgi:hypothetical protein
MNRRLSAALSGPSARSRGRRTAPAAGSIVAQPMPGPLVLDLVAALVQGGAAPHSALQAIGDALRQQGDPRGDELLLAASRISRPGTGAGSSLGSTGFGSAGFGFVDPGAAAHSVQFGRPARAVRRLFDRLRPGGAGSGQMPLLAAMEEALLLAARSGLPPTALVRRAAAEERRRQVSAQLRAIRKLEVLLVIPAGLCLLPAFVLLGIVPLVIDLIAG